VPLSGSVPAGGERTAEATIGRDMRFSAARRSCCARFGWTSRSSSRSPGG
jgi:hypothetical protein